MNRFRTFLVSLAALALLVCSTLIATTLADNGPNHRVRNLHFGVSGGNVNDASRRFCCSGTLGALVTDGATQYILSNNHVLGLAGQATAGDDVSQPGLIDNGCRIATVVGDFTAAPALSSNVDCAIAALRPGTMDPTGFIEDIGTISSVPRTPSVGLGVAKSGRTTGFQTGSVSSVSTTVSIKYPTSCGGKQGPTFTFTNQVVINSSTFSAGGDSGSLIVTNDANHQPVALLFAGSSTSTIGNPINLVLTRLSSTLGRSVSFVGAPLGAATAPAFAISPEGAIMLEPSELAVAGATRALRDHEAELMSLPGVLGVGVGQGSKNKTEAVIVVYVNRDDPKASLGVPKLVDGVRVKRVLTDEFVAR
ncbi:MAG TPA: hypothetical protein VM864_04525 [Pyrinomonadaceae bacterium]|jgi:hypothetical protein|nr:hypothetical protein [Pyrinomonadaceae bacterium]